MEVLDSKATIKKFLDFFEEYKKKDIKRTIHQNLGFLTVSFFEISEFDYELGDLLLNHPQEVISLMEETLKQFQDEREVKPIKVWLTSLPESEKVMIRDVRSEHLGKLVLIEGIVRRKTDVRPRLTHIEYLCTNPSCTYSEEKLRIPQIEDKAVMLKACPKCKSGVELINKTLIDSQSLVLEELTQDLENSADQPKRLNILLQDDLVSPFKDSRTNPGSMVYVVGFVKEVPIPTRTGSESVHYDLILDAIYIDLMEEDFSEIVISKEEEEQIKQLSKKDNIVEVLTNNFAPAIYGYQKIKEAILLQQFGGKGASRGDGIKARGNIHILIIGDPGAAKSQMLKAASKIAPKSSFVSGKSASGVGLCVSPNSVIQTDNGEMHKIKDLVENNFQGKEEPYNDWIWKRDNVKNFKIQSLSNDLKLQLKYPKTLWRLKAPAFVNEVVLSSGKKIELTGNTQLLILRNGNLEWVKSDSLKTDDFVATPRKLFSGNNKKVYTIDLIKSDPHIHNFEGFIKELNDLLIKKYGSLREASNKLEIHENNLYSKWVRNDLNGLPKLSNIKKIANDLEIPYKDKIKEVSLYNGKNIFIPPFIDEDILYFAGLIAGDGDFREIKKTKTYSIRLSNSDENLHYIFRNILKNKFNLSFDVQKSISRVESTRTHSRLLGEILLELGIPLSPKSNKLFFSNLILNFDNKLLSSFISGLIDSDGSIYFSENGSSSISYFSSSENFITTLQKVFLRFGINSRIRKREPNIGKFLGKYNRWVLEIRGSKNFVLFDNNFILKSEKKSNLLKKVVSLNLKQNSNVDVLPSVGEKIKNILIKHNVGLKKIGWHKNFSFDGLNKFLEKLEFLEDKDLDDIRRIAQSDIFFEKIVEINRKKPEYDYVYDLTVDESHNFVVDGVLVHNTATVMKDELTRGWALEAGAMVLASGGLCAIDELDKMSDEDTSSMHEALEQQTISIAKANIRATLRCETTVLGAANPLNGRFDPYGDIAKQINFPPALMSRFDLIFILRDIPDKKRDDLIANHILQVHKDVSKTISDLPADFMKKYVAYAKRIKPVLNKDAIVKIREFYVAMRNSGGEEEANQAKSVPITARQLEAIVRLAEAYAKIRLASHVTVQYAQEAIDLLKYCLEKIGIDPKTGELDIDRITTGVTTSTRNMYTMVSKMIDKLEAENPEIKYDDIIVEATANKIDLNELEKTLDKLKKDAYIYEPKKNIYKKL